jgi:metal-responsive CopG/Arc/MetJ family transcriptional regulator
MIISKYSKYVQLGISLPKEIVDIIDEIRKDVPRSRYILRLIEKSLTSFENGLRIHSNR